MTWKTSLSLPWLLEVPRRRDRLGRVSHVRCSLSASELSLPWKSGRQHIQAFGHVCGHRRRESGLVHVALTARCGVCLCAQCLPGIRSSWGAVPGYCKSCHQPLPWKTRMGSHLTSREEKFLGCCVHQPGGRRGWQCCAAVMTLVRRTGLVPGEYVSLSVSSVFHLSTKDRGK